MSRPLVISMGCRLNAAEADAAGQLAQDAGLSDAIIVNTCAVTAESVRQSTQSIRRLKRDHPERRIVVTGCAAQLDPHRFAAMPEIDAVVGNAEKLNRTTFDDIVRLGGVPANGPVVRVGDIMRHAPKAEGDLDAGTSHAPAGAQTSGRTRAILSIQNGCDHRCTFCIIPFARGPSRSIAPEAAVQRVQALVDQGHKEVVLTGVDLTSYGSDLDPCVSLGRLVQRILVEVPSLKRLRLSSIDQVEADDALLDAFAGDARFMPHLHLSMQSGDDLILKRMKRRHSRADAIEFCARVRRVRPDVVLGADLIAGFPTETDAMFQNTREAVVACGLTYLHVFPYSRRPGTPADRMPQVDPATIAARAAILRADAQARQRAFLEQHVGGEYEILMERGGTGRTPQFAEVAVHEPPHAGCITRVRVTGYDGKRLQGVVARAAGRQAG